MGIDFFWTQTLTVRLSCYTGWLSPFTNMRCHLPTGKKILFIITCTKIRWCRAPITSPALIYAPGQLMRARHLMSYVIRGLREKYCWRGDGWYNCALKVPSHVTWWKRMYCGASAGQDWFVMLFVLCLLILCFPPSPSLKRFWHVEIHTTLPCPPKGPPSLQLLTHPPLIRCLTSILECFLFFFFFRNSIF